MLEIGRVALRLGLTSFGGPIAHLGYFHEEYVVRRRWLDEATYADLIALCQILPGPSSSQLGIAIGTLRAGVPGGLVAWLGFTLPSAVALAVFAALATPAGLAQAGWLDGLKVAAVAIVAQAVIAMWRSLAADRPRSLIAIATAIAALLMPSPFTQLALIVAGAFVGWIALRPTIPAETADLRSPIGRRAGAALLGLFACLLLALPILRAVVPDRPVALADAFFRAGALVFGGGHVVLPLLHGSVVPPGWVTDDQFLAGYGAAQAVPGPLFTFAAYLGEVIGGPLMAAVALVAIFAPGFLLIWGTLPFWHDLRRSQRFRRALVGTNAAVVGILLAALYRPVWVSAVTAPTHAIVAILAFAALLTRRVPPWAVVLLCAAAGEALAR